MPEARIIDGICHFGPVHVLIAARSVVQKMAMSFINRGIPFYTDKKEGTHYICVDENVDLERLSKRYTFTLEE